MLLLFSIPLIHYKSLLRLAAHLSSKIVIIKSCRIIASTNVEATGMHLFEKYPRSIRYKRRWKKSLKCFKKYCRTRIRCKCCLN